jgi:hypothetical protein
MNFFSKIAPVILIALLATSMVFGQKEADKSRLNIGTSPKKPSLVVSNSILSKNNLPKSISFSSKTNYTQFYRDLLISNKSLNADSKAAPSQSQDFSFDKVKLSNIYPNPANDFTNLDITVNNNFNTASISFFNLLGKQVADFEITRNSDKIRINTSNWESGIYSYQLVVDGKKIATKKLLVRHN